MAKQKFYEFYPDLNVDTHRWKVTQLKSQIKQLQESNPEDEMEEILQRIMYRPIGTSKKKSKQSAESLQE